MITSTLDQLHWYKIISPHFAKAIDYVLATPFEELDMGKYIVDGEDVFAIINEYNTKACAECEPESHRVYADIQLMIRGTEKFGYTPQTGQPAGTPYNLEKDVALYRIPEDAIDYITLRPGQFIIFFPSDIHQPEVFHNQPEPVKKVVMKIRVS